MNAATELSEIFSVLHDSTIESAKGEKEHLTLRVGCQYLAELFNPSFYFFYVELIGISEFTFISWEEPAVATVDTPAALALVLAADLEIVSAKVEHERTIITCIEPGSSSGSGGELIISCQQVILYDQEKRELSLDTLRTVANNYWDRWSSGDSSQ
jgi:hypothetical protein